MSDRANPAKPLFPAQTCPECGGDWPHTASEAWLLKGPRGVHESPESRLRLYQIRDELKEARKYKEVL